MLRFDVESFFTNVPLGFTINLILDRVNKHKEFGIMIPEHELKKLLNLCIKGNTFCWMVP